MSISNKVRSFAEPFISVTYAGARAVALSVAFMTASLILFVAAASILRRTGGASPALVPVWGFGTLLAFMVFKKVYI